MIFSEIFSSGSASKVGVIRENRFGEIPESDFFERDETTLGDLVRLVFDSIVRRVSV